MVRKNTLPVGDRVFREVYDSPASLPGRHKWLTHDEDVRQLEALLGMQPMTIGAPLWVSGDRKTCPKFASYLFGHPVFLDGVWKKAELASELWEWDGACQ